jgi:hypothetical protein
MRDMSSTYFYILTYCYIYIYNNISYEFDIFLNVDIFPHKIYHLTPTHNVFCSFFREKPAISLTISWHRNSAFFGDFVQSKKLWLTVNLFSTTYWRSIPWLAQKSIPNYKLESALGLLPTLADLLCGKEAYCTVIWVGVVTSNERTNELLHSQRDMDRWEEAQASLRSLAQFRWQWQRIGNRRCCPSLCCTVWMDDFGRAWLKAFTLMVQYTTDSRYLVGVGPYLR